MAITKNKIELLDKTISLESAIEEYFNEGYDDYYELVDSELIFDDFCEKLNESLILWFFRILFLFIYFFE